MRKQIPLWIIAALGSDVVLTKPLEGACEVYQPGYAGRLLGIEAAPGGLFFLTIQLDPEDPGYIENVAIDAIRPYEDSVSMSVNYETATLDFEVRESVFYGGGVWAAGHR